MSNIGTGDVTYVLVNQRKMSDSRNLNRVRLSFGDGALTYPANGIPLVKGKMGCPTIIESLIVVDAGVSGYRFQYDQSAEKLVLLQAPAQTHTHDLFLRDNVIGADTSTTKVGAGANKLGANTGANITVTGGGANGGIVSTTLAASALVEASAVAIAAQVIEVEVIGY
jgi:hypothetical protein